MFNPVALRTATSAAAPLVAAVAANPLLLAVVVGGALVIAGVYIGSRFASAPA